MTPTDHPLPPRPRPTVLFTTRAALDPATARRHGVSAAEAAAWRRWLDARRDRLLRRSGLEGTR